MRRALLLGCWAASLALAACSSGQDKADYNDVAQVDPTEARAQAAIDNTAAAVGPRAVARAGLPVSMPTPTAARGRALPTAFQGYWGATPGDCDLRTADAAGRISVDADTIRLFEAKARVQRLTERSPTMVDAQLRMSRDGGDWTQTTRLVLEQGGTRLRIEREGAPTIPYQRC